MDLNFQRALAEKLRGLQGSLGLTPQQNPTPSSIGEGVQQVQQLPAYRKYQEESMMRGETPLPPDQWRQQMYQGR
jgi:hypothetical protein